MEIGSDVQEGSDVKVSSLCFSSPVLCCRTCISGKKCQSSGALGICLGFRIGNWKPHWIFRNERESPQDKHTLDSCAVPVSPLTSQRSISGSVQVTPMGLPCTHQNVLQLQLSPLAGLHTWYRVSNTLDRLLTQGCRVLVVILTFLLPSAKSFPVVFSNAVRKADFTGSEICLNVSLQL